MHSMTQIKASHFAYKRDMLHRKNSLYPLICHLKLSYWRTILVPKTYLVRSMFNPHNTITQHHLVKLFAKSTYPLELSNRLCCSSFHSSPSISATRKISCGFSCCFYKSCHLIFPNILQNPWE